jgi:hypothetical protein
VSGQLHAVAAFPHTHSVGGLESPRAGLDNVEKKEFLILPGLELRSLGPRVLSLTLYRRIITGSWLSLEDVEVFKCLETLTLKLY